MAVTDPNIRIIMFKERKEIVLAIPALFIGNDKAFPQTFVILALYLIGQSWDNSSCEKTWVNNYLGFLDSVRENSSYKGEESWRNYWVIQLIVSATTCFAYVIILYCFICYHKCVFLF